MEAAVCFFAEEINENGGGFFWNKHGNETVENVRMSDDDNNAMAHLHTDLVLGWQVGRAVQSQTDYVNLLVHSKPTHNTQTSSQCPLKSHSISIIAQNYSNLKSVAFYALQISE